MLLCRVSCPPSLPRYQAGGSCSTVVFWCFLFSEFDRIWQKYLDGGTYGEVRAQQAPQRICWREAMNGIGSQQAAAVRFATGVSVGEACRPTWQPAKSLAVAAVGLVAAVVAAALVLEGVDLYVVVGVVVLVALVVVVVEVVILIPPHEPIRTGHLPATFRFRFAASVPTSCFFSVQRRTWRSSYCEG